MAANASTAPKQRKPNRFQDLFFFKRRPRRNLVSEWQPPATDEAFERLIDDDGFVSALRWQEQYGEDITQHPIIAQDLADLKQHLLPTFFQLNTKAKYYQNQFYMYQWIFVWGAFLTTLLGTLSAFTANSQVAATEDLSRVFSLATAIVGAFTAYVTQLSNRGRPQERWAKTRTLTEEVRTQYFKYLSHLAPYDKPDRVQKLRENMVEVRVKEQENQGGAA
jgi:hypothetical protein